MSTPAENAATVREALEIAALAEQEAEIFNGYDQERRVAALDALLAQAEAAEAELELRVAAEIAEAVMVKRAEAAEAERDLLAGALKAVQDDRDAAVRQATENGRLAQKHWDRAEAAERAAEQAQKALRQVWQACDDRRGLAAIRNIARASLTREGMTEPYPAPSSPADTERYFYCPRCRARLSS